MKKIICSKFVQEQSLYKKTYKVRVVKEDLKLETFCLYHIQKKRWFDFIWITIKTMDNISSIMANYYEYDKKNKLL